MVSGIVEVAFVGQRLRRKVLLSLALCSGIPLLILAYILYGHLRPQLDSLVQPSVIVSLHGLIVFAGLLMLAGGYVIWDVAAAVTKAADSIGKAKPFQGLAGRTDEIGALINSFSHMVTTIEAQAAEINTFTTRLDAAYKELEAANARLKDLSFKDEVTGLYNRRFLSVRLEEEVSRCRRFNHPVSMVLLDLDDFKTINDELGHSSGDETLRQVGQLLLKHSRGINVICRYAGDEFAVILVETSKAGARLYADRIRQVLAASSFSHARQITASFGVASLPEDVPPVAAELIQAADEALYVAKRAGRNRVEGYEPVPEPNGEDPRERAR
jgi:diguanylate cyclase (GGDEF)-like protein